MFEGSRLRPMVTGVAMVLSATTLVACGDSSDDATKAKASTPARPTTTQAAASSAAPAPPQVVVPDKGRTAQGTGRLSALRLGTPGQVVVEPKGAVPGPGTEHWYKFGTEVTLRAKSTRTARFGGWAGDPLCKSQGPVCKLKITNAATTIVIGFNLNAKGAKGLKKSDPRLKVVISD